MLAESILIGRPYLGTADLDSDRKFDVEAKYQGAHELGQFWFAVLWDLYQAKR